VGCVLRPDELLDFVTIITDFEDAVLRAVTAVFGPHINHQGCFYHLTQASWRKIQQLGLVLLYNNDDDFRLFCGMMESLNCTKDCIFKVCDDSLDIEL
jgi:hypothetical protein